MTKEHFDHVKGKLVQNFMTVMSILCLYYFIKFESQLRSTNQILSLESRTR